RERPGPSQAQALPLVEQSAGRVASASQSSCYPRTQASAETFGLPVRLSAEVDKPRHQAVTLANLPARSFPICTAFVAAPLRRLSLTHQKLMPQGWFKS